MTVNSFDLNLRHLRAMSIIVEKRSLVAAALSAGLSQPALTQGLRKLEHQLGVRLFDRRPHGMEATPAGVVFADRTGFAFDHLAAAMRRIGGRGFDRPEQLATATQLKAFLALADSNSFAQAGRRNGLSQPAIHRAVRDLEQICGVALAERRGRFVTLTSAGRRLARGVRLAALELSAGISTVRGDPEVDSRIVIGAMPLSRALVLPHAIAAFLDGTPRAQIEIVEGSWRELAEPLRDGVIDLMVGALRDAETPGLVQHALFDDRLIVVGRADHPLSAQSATIDQLRRERWIVGSPGSPLRARWEDLFADDAFPDAPVECGSVMVIRGILAKSDLLSLLSPDQVALEIDSGMLARIRAPFVDSVRAIGLTTRDEWRPTAAQARLVSLIEEAARSTRPQENQ